MTLVYNSDTFAVLAVDLSAHGGYEIVDKSSRQGIFIEGVVAQSFRAQAEALVQSEASAEDIDELLGRYTAMAPAHAGLH